jgi:hypothetical protein
LHGIELGRTVDALVAPDTGRLIGFEVVCGDENHRFLPFAVAGVRDDELVLDSALMLIDERDLAFYRRHSRRLRDLGYADPWIDEDGLVHEARSAA